MALLTSNNVTCWKENFAIFLNLVLIILILRWLWNFKTMLSMTSQLLVKLLTIPVHLKRFKEGTISAK